MPRIYRRRAALWGEGAGAAMSQTTQEISDQLQELSLKRQKLDERKKQLEDLVSDARIDIIEINMQLRDVEADLNHLMDALVASMQPPGATGASRLPPLVHLR